MQRCRADFKNVHHFTQRFSLGCQLKVVLLGRVIVEPSDLAEQENGVRLDNALRSEHIFNLAQLSEQIDQVVQPSLLRAKA